MSAQLGIQFVWAQILCEKRVDSTVDISSPKTNKTSTVVSGLNFGLKKRIYLTLTP